MKYLILLFLLLLVSVPFYSSGAQTADTPDAVLSQGLTQIAVGEMLVSEQFDPGAAFEPYENEATHLRVVDGQYRMEILQPDVYSWESIQTSYGDVVIEMDVTFLEDFGIDVSGGILCRTQSYDDPLGYFLEVSPAGTYLITRYDADGFLVIADGTNTEAIQMTNHLVGVCVEDYLALYSNGQLVMETVDSTFESGFVGWTASLFADFAGTSPANVTIDNLTVWSASEVSTSAQQPQPDFTQGEVSVMVGRHLRNETFDHPDSWLPYKTEDTNFRVEDGVYLVEVTEPITSWVSTGLLLEDTIIQAEIQQLSEFDINSMGLICRATLDDSGYRFWFGGDGLYNIALWVEGERTDLIESPQPITNLQETNILTAVCIDDYLALYVNGDLVAETRDSTLTLGSTGIMASVGGEKQIIQAQFDNLNIWTATSP